MYGARGEGSGGGLGEGRLGGLGWMVGEVREGWDGDGGVGVVWRLEGDWKRGCNERWVWQGSEVKDLARGSYM